MIKRITREKLKQTLDSADAFVLVDTLPASAYRKRHLTHAINIPSDDIVEIAPRAIPDRKTEIVVHCANARASRPSALRTSTRATPFQTAS